MLSVKKQSIEGTKWVFLEKLSNQGVNFVFGIFMARILSPSDFGVLSMINIIIHITSIFIDSGFSTSLIRKNNQNEKDYSTVFYFNIVIAAVVYLLLFFLSNKIASFFDMSILGKIIRVQAVCLIFNSLASVQVVRLTVGLRFKPLALISLSSSVISGSIAIYLALKGVGVWSLVWQSLTFSFINLLLITLYCRWIPSQWFSMSSFKELGGFGVKILATSLIHTIYIEMTSLIIGKFYSAKDLGYYKRGSEFAQMPVSAINGVLQKVTFPIMAKIQDDTTRLINVYRKYIKISSMVIFIFCTTLIAVAKPLILFLLGSKWSESILYLQIFGLAYMFDHISSINLNLLKVVGRSDLLLKIEIIKKTISIIMILGSAPFGILSICFAMLVYSQISIIINTYYTGKLFGLGYWTQIKDFFKYLVLSFFASFPALLISYIPIAPVLALISGGILSISLYYLFLRKDEMMMELVGAVKKNIPFRKK